ncbi:transferase [Kitasatospora sp. NBC_00240]|uniref:transferase n=1 Tax=Kitasatospora sp. NBC_00240 TaxID=2903567 RepID=UPI00225BA958|nr:transferase [Kitasatospora sp. NBC_00240]MCX5208833.1 transferase [Kitasatospora sp. NBC_00240]
MSSSSRALARLITVTAVVAAYIALHLAITAGQDLQARDRFRDGPARAAAFTAVLDRYANGDESARTEIAAAKRWFEENAPAGRARTSVAATAGLVEKGEASAARERARTLVVEAGQDRTALDRDLGSWGRAALWFTAAAGALAVPALWLRRRRRAASAEVVQAIGRFAARRPRWRRPLFLAAGSVGYTLFIGGFMAVSMVQRNGRELPPATQILMLPLGLAALGAGFLILRYTRPRSTRGAARALQADGRRPVLYLRSFADDHTAAQVDDGTALNIHSREEQLAAALGAFGPVIAVGRPGEPLPLLGAARFYLPLDDWKPTILRLMELSQLIVLRVGSGAGLRWEIEQAVATQPGRKLLLLTPGRVADAVEGLDGQLPKPLHLEEVAADTTWISAAVAFGADWTPHVRAVEPAPGTAAPRGGPVRRSYQAVKAVFWEPSPARRTVGAMKAALASVGVRRRMVVLRSDSNMLSTLGKGYLAIAALALPYRLLELVGVR